MNTIETQNCNQGSKRILPRWAGAIVCGVGIPVVHGLVPWAISLLTVRHGWVNFRPGPWNFAGLILVAIACTAIVWALAGHFAEAPRGWEFERTPKYLLTRGPYRFTRHPIYLSYAVLWTGWVIFYGSIAVLIGLVLAWPFGNAIVTREERNLEARFGEAHREYKRTVPRSWGKVRR